MPTAAPTRFVALDVHKYSIMVAALDAQQHLLMPPRRFGVPEFEAWAPEHLTSTDAVVLEATTTAWHLYDLLRPLVASVTVAHPLMVKLITAVRVKTDSRDTINLARLLAANLIPAVWVPPQEVHHLRTLVAHRQRLIWQRAQLRNRLQSLLQVHHLAPPQGGLFAAYQRAWWEGLELPHCERLQVRQDWALLVTLAPLISEVEAELMQLSTVEPWATQVPFLVQLPGIGVLNAMILLSAIGDITRFPTAKHLVSYGGLGVSIHASGQTARTGGITKQGRREIRSTLVEAAWVAIAKQPHWKAIFEHLAARIGKRKAIVAVARKLLVVLWQVLTHRVADWHAEGEAVARKFLSWGSRGRTARRLGMARADFVRLQLKRLALENQVTTISYGGEVVKLFPEGTPSSPG